jgi:hypothetical protein
VSRNKTTQIVKLESAYADLESLALKESQVNKFLTEENKSLRKVNQFQSEQIKEYEKALRKHKVSGLKLILAGAGAFLVGLVLGGL